MKRCDDGMTLVEICLVGVIIACLFAVAWPAFGRMSSSIRLNLASSRMMHAVIFARERAMAEGRRYRVVFDSRVPQCTLSVEENGVFSVPKDATDRADAVDGVKVQDINASAIVVNPDGTGDDFTVTLKNERGATKTLRYQGNFGRFTINEHEKT